uniref:Reverse transcriptase/retrotransposon-derived protein RNase H-like domain-containing protein n=1 Tax=Nicotiana tabacum TaxID=4097 RepID=A0A1S4AJJ5_TOBAC|nr:PREDICTED: uncharacterized protein LOC107798322 [Nicotiana tabacum]
MLEKVAGHGCYYFLDGYSSYNQIPIALEDVQKTIFTCPPATHLVLNWEKCHFMVKEGIVLGYKVNAHGIEVDRSKADVIARLPPSTSEKLVSVPIMVAPDWSQPFEIMCDASDVAVGAVMGQRKDKMFRPIYYARKTLNVA